MRKPDGGRHLRQHGLDHRLFLKGRWRSRSPDPFDKRDGGAFITVFQSTQAEVLQRPIAISRRSPIDGPRVGEVRSDF